MLKKFLFIFTFLLYGFVFSQNDSLTAAGTKAIHYSESDILIDNDSVTKANFESNFQRKYQTPDFDYEVKVPEKSFWDKFLDWLGFWLGRIFHISNPKESFGYAIVTMKVIAVIVLLGVVYLIVKLMLNKEGNWIFGKSVKNKIEYDDLEQNLKNIDFSKLISETVAQGNNRLVVRYYYLWVLKKLSETDIINFIPEKTNSDYYNEIQSEKIKTDFKYVSYLYNYIWYGEFELDDETFDKAKVSFVKMIQSI